MTKPILTPEMLRKLLRYEPDTGMLFWRVRPVEMFDDGKKHTAEHICKWWNAHYAGAEALKAVNSNGYKTGHIFNIIYRSQRVIWAMETGTWPNEIDHIDHDRTNNRFENLRAATRQENTRNKSLGVANTSGIIGVHWDKRRQKWRATIGIDWKHKHLGWFTNKAEAAVVRKAAEIKHGFHPNHGRA